MKPQYQHLRCKICRKFDAYKVFDVGFDNEVSIKIREDYAHTSDRIFVITEKFVDVLRSAKIEGYETKPIGSTGWNAFRVTLMIDSDDNGVIKTSGSQCPECGRPEQTWGLHSFLRDLVVPLNTKTFFTTKTGWPSAPFYDRSIFISEEIALLLKSAGIKGGYCSQLMTEEHARKLEEGQRRGVDLTPLPGTTIFLTGKKPGEVRKK